MPSPQSTHSVYNIFVINVKVDFIGGSTGATLLHDLADPNFQHIFLDNYNTMGIITDGY